MIQWDKGQVRIGWFRLNPEGLVEVVCHPGVLPEISVVFSDKGEEMSLWYFWQQGGPYFWKLIKSTELLKPAVIATVLCLHSMIYFLSEYQLKVFLVDHSSCCLRDHFSY